MSQSTAQIQPQTNGTAHIAPAPAPASETSADEIQRIFKLQQAHQFTVAKTTANERKEKLKRLQRAILAYKQEIRDAMHADFQKHPSEVDLTETYVVTSEIKHTIAHLSKWMRPKKVKTPFALLGTKSHIHYEPKGVCLLISPWNYPVNLTFGPLVSAIASGNCVMIKPSEMTPHTSAVMKKIVDEV
ncbi:MAG: aldehyde dehydrogenase family protein, partial [Myxococcota bacterium]